MKSPRKKIYKAIATGELKIGDVRIPCAVLDDKGETRVISQRGINKALGRAQPSGKSGGDSPLPFPAPNNIKPFISKDLLVATPIRYLPKHRGKPALALPAKFLGEVCAAWIKADREGALYPRQKENCISRCDTFSCLRRGGDHRSH